MESVAQLDAGLTTPSEALIRDLAGLDGDIVVIGSAGKMGPTLTHMAKRAVDAASASRRVTGVSRFSNTAVRKGFEEAGIETVAVDLLDPAQLERLPDAANVIYMMGTKFGTTGREYLTWAANAYAPGRIAERYAASRIVVFSSGNVYPLTPVTSGGATEITPPRPIGEYAQSCLARERVFEHFSRVHDTPLSIMRLNYAIDLRYGVLLDVGMAVNAGEEVDLAMGNANVIWQGDACEMALRCLTVCNTPPRVLNVTGPETISIRWLAEQFGERLGKRPNCTGEEAPTALLSNAAVAFGLFGYPRVTLSQMIDWTARWIQEGGATINKPTHFTEREGQF